MRRPARVSEKVEQAQVVQLLRTIGAAVYVLGHASPNDGRAHRGTTQTPGVPDLYAILPARSDDAPTAVWIEVKATGGRLRPEQQAFASLCATAGVAHLVGGYDRVVAWLLERKRLAATSVPHYRLPKSFQGAQP